MTYFRLLSALCAFVMLSAMSCDKLDTEKDNQQTAILDEDFCHNIAAECPKLAALAKAYPPKLEEEFGSSYYIHAELLSYLLDSIIDNGQYYQRLPGACPGLTREQIHCALGVPNDPGGYLEIFKDIPLSGDDYSYARDPEYGNDPTPYWTEPFYISTLLYNSGDSLAVVLHNGL